MKSIDAEWVRNAVVGGTILGGGGGGNPARGKSFAELALQVGSPTLVGLEELEEEAILLAVSAVGAPSTNPEILPAHYVRATTLLLDAFTKEVSGLMPNEVGGFAVVNGLMQSAILAIPIVDVACNGRAHPTGLMGAMGLSQNREALIYEAGVGGSPADANYLEIVTKGCLSTVAKVVRAASELVGGIIAVARTPVDARYVRDHAAVGALSFAEAVGRAFFSVDAEKGRIQGVISALGGEVVQTGNVEHLELSLRGGFDVGKAVIGGCELTFWNEYMTLDRNDERVATFPDLIMTLDATSGNPITSAELRENQKVALIVAPKERLILGAGMRDPDLFRPAEEAVGKSIIDYVFRDSH